MTALEKRPPGPRSNWRPQIDADKSRVILHNFPKTLYPKVYLDTIENAKEQWSQRRKGYPHIEDVYLVSTPNLGASGNCYFMAIATLLYGSKRYWHTVKGHHLQYVDRVLRYKSDPRHELYTKINSNLSTSSQDGGDALNLWMRLCTPYAWQDGEILQVTADLYDVFIVQYTMKSDHQSVVEGVKIRGNYNSTHWMIRYIDNNHFQPLLPADQPLSEFSFPRITRRNTKGKVSVPNQLSKGATDLNHPWRSPMSRMDVPEQACPIWLFRELSSLEFTFITGFNTKSSTLDPKCLQLQYLRAAAESLPLPLYADESETVESKIIKQKDSGSPPKKRKKNVKTKGDDHISPANPSKKIKTGQNETKKAVASPSSLPANPLPEPPVKPTLLPPKVPASPHIPQPKQRGHTTTPKGDLNVVKPNPEPAKPSMPGPSSHPILETTTKPTHKTKTGKGKIKHSNPPTPQANNPLPTSPESATENPQKRIKFIPKAEYEKIRESKRKKLDP